MSVGAVMLALAAVVAVALLALIYGRRHFRNVAALPPPGGWPEEASPSRATAPTRLIELERLRRNGEIDEIEYQNRRKELLG